MSAQFISYIDLNWYTVHTGFIDPHTTFQMNGMHKIMIPTNLPAENHGLIYTNTLLKTSLGLIFHLKKKSKIEENNMGSLDLSKHI